MSDHVTITRNPGAANASFETIDTTQGEMVYWKNEDTEAHWPIFSAVTPAVTLNFQAGPLTNSDSLQPSLGNTASASPAVITQGTSVTVSYTCKLHSGEAGTINVWADFRSQPNQMAGATHGQAYSANLTIGGKPPYTFQVSNSNLPASLTVKDVKNAQGVDQGLYVSGTPGSGDTGSFAFDLTCEDALENNITQTYLLTVS